MRGTGHLPLSGIFVMRIPVYGSQSGSLELNIESVFAANIDSFQIMNRYCSHHFHHLLTSGSDSTIPDKFLKFPSYMLLFGEKD